MEGEVGGRINWLGGLTTSLSRRSGGDQASAGVWSKELRDVQVVNSSRSRGTPSRFQLLITESIATSLRL